MPNTQIPKPKNWVAYNIPASIRAFYTASELSDAAVLDYMAYLKTYVAQEPSAAFETVQILTGSQDADRVIAEIAGKIQMQPTPRFLFMPLILDVNRNPFKIDPDTYLPYIDTALHFTRHITLLIFDQHQKKIRFYNSQGSSIENEHCFLVGVKNMSARGFFKKLKSQPCLSDYVYDYYNPKVLHASFFYSETDAHQVKPDVIHCGGWVCRMMRECILHVDDKEAFEKACVLPQAFDIAADRKQMGAALDAWLEGRAQYWVKPLDQTTEASMQADRAFTPPEETDSLGQLPPAVGSFTPPTPVGTPVDDSSNLVKGVQEKPSQP